MRELVIHFGRTGYLALCEIEDHSSVAVLAVVHPLAEVHKEGPQESRQRSEHEHVGGQALLTLCRHGGKNQKGLEAEAPKPLI